MDLGCSSYLYLAGLLELKGRGCTWVQGLSPAGCRPRVEQEAARGAGSFSLLLGRQAPGRHRGDRRGACPAAPAGVGEVAGQAEGWRTDAEARWGQTARTAAQTGARGNGRGAVLEAVIDSHSWASCWAAGLCSIEPISCIG